LGGGRKRDGEFAGWRIYKGVEEDIQVAVGFCKGGGREAAR